MNMLTGRTKCNGCGIVLPDDDPPEARPPCPNCGARSRNCSEHISDSLRALDQIFARVKRPTATGKRKWPFKVKNGYEFSGDGSGRLVYKFQLIDLDADSYIEVVQDAKTLEILKAQSHPLSQHRGYGSDKFRKDLQKDGD